MGWPQDERDLLQREACSLVGKRIMTGDHG